MSDEVVVMWDDVPTSQRNQGYYQGYGPTEHRGCAAAVKWPTSETYSHCASRAMSATGLCRRHSERLGLIGPKFQFHKVRAHRTETGERVIGGIAETASSCVKCSQPIKVGELVTPIRAGVHTAVCATCSPIHRAPGNFNYVRKLWVYDGQFAVDGCHSCLEDRRMMDHDTCTHCGGTGKMPSDPRPAEPTDAGAS